MRPRWPSVARGAAGPPSCKHRLAEKGEWDIAELRIELQELVIDGAPIEIIGFSDAEVDDLMAPEEVGGPERGPLAPPEGAVAVARRGDVFALGDHRLVCGDSTALETFAAIDGGRLAALVLTDPPYNVAIRGNVSGGAHHREFAMASGEMSAAEFSAFNRAWMAAALPSLVNGGIIANFIDWRGLASVTGAAEAFGLTPLHLIVWAKTNAGMGSFYRSQHELLPLHKKGTADHINNIKLGKAGRHRSNVWTYPGASTVGSDARKGLREHPTVKPTAMLADAICDMTNRGDLVLDPFLGSGSTLMAAETTGRACHAVEIDPLYVDVALRRFKTATGIEPVLVDTSETFDTLTARRAAEAQVVS